MRFITTKFSDFPTHLIVIRLHLVAHGNRIRRAIRQRRVRDARVIDFAPEDAGGGVFQISPVIDPAIQVGFARGGVGGGVAGVRGASTVLHVHVVRVLRRVIGPIENRVVLPHLRVRQSRRLGDGDRLLAFRVLLVPVAQGVGAARRGVLHEVGVQVRPVAIRVHLPRRAVLHGVGPLRRILAVRTARRMTARIARHIVESVGGHEQLEVIPVRIDRRRGEGDGIFVCRRESGARALACRHHFPHAELRRVLTSRIRFVATRVGGARAADCRAIVALPEAVVIRLDHVRRTMG